MASRQAQDQFELGQQEMHLRSSHSSGLFKGVGQVNTGQLEKGWREDRAEEVLTSENYRTHGFLLVSHDKQLPGPRAGLESTTGETGGMARKGQIERDCAGGTATLNSQLDAGV